MPGARGRIRRDLKKLRESRRCLVALLRHDVRIAEHVSHFRSRSFPAYGLLEASRKAVHLNPKNPGAPNNLGLLLVKTRRADEGIAEFQKALAEDPNNNDARFNIGFAHLLKAELDQAIAAFRDLIARDPNHAPAHYNLGVALKNKDDIDGAKAEFGRALEIDPSMAEAHYMIGITCWKSGDSTPRPAGCARRSLSGRTTEKRTSCWEPC